MILGLIFGLTIWYLSVGVANVILFYFVGKRTGRGWGKRCIFMLVLWLPVWAKFWREQTVEENKWVLTPIDKLVIDDDKEAGGK